MRLNRFWLVCAGLAVLLFTLLVVLRLHLPSPGVTPANFQRLYKGMHEKEVAAIMGGPDDSPMYFTGNHYSSWRGSDCNVSIRFNDMGTMDGRKSPYGGDAVPDAIEGTMFLKDGSKLELREKSALDFFRNLIGL